MTRIVRRPLAVSPLALFVGSVLLMDVLAIAFVVVLMSRGYIVGDWISFYTGGTLFRTGNATHLYDAAAQAAVQHQLFGVGAKTLGYPLPAFVAFLFAPLIRLSFLASYLWCGWPSTSRCWPCCCG
jgi:hypothetical protein